MCIRDSVKRVSRANASWQRKNQVNFNIDLVYIKHTVKDIKIGIKKKRTEYSNICTMGVPK